MDKDKNLPVQKKYQEVNIPPNMTAEDYQDMGITRGQRISLDIRLKCIEQIVKLTSAGYLTPEEEQKRINWIQDAQTQEQIDVAFSDLQKSLMQFKFDEYTATRVKKESPKKHSPVGKGTWTATVFAYIVLWLCISLSIVSGQWVLLGIYSVYLIGLTYAVAYRVTRDEQ